MHKRFAPIGAIAVNQEQSLEPLPLALEFGKEHLGPCLVRNIGRSNDNHQHQAKGRNQQVPFATLDLFATVKADCLVSKCANLDRLRVDIGTQTSYTLARSDPIGSDVNGALEMLRGVAQAQNEVNQAGGINQTPLQIVIADDSNEPDIAKQIAEIFVNDLDVMGVIGHYASDVTLAVGETYEAGELTAISPVSTSVKLTGFGNYIFRTVPSDSVAAQALVNYTRSQLGTSNVAVFYNSQSGYSESLKLEFSKYLNEAQEQATNTLIFDLSDSDFDANQSVEQAIASGAEALILLPNTTELDDALQVVNANNQRLPILAGDDVYAPKTLEIGTANAEGMIVAVPYHISASQTNFPDTSFDLWKAYVNWRTAILRCYRCLNRWIAREPNL